MKKTFDYNFCVLKFFSVHVSKIHSGITFVKCLVQGFILLSLLKGVKRKDKNCRIFQNKIYSLMHQTMLILK